MRLLVLDARARRIVIYLPWNKSSSHARARRRSTGPPQLLALVLDGRGRARARRARRRRRPAEEHGLAPARRAGAQRAGRAGGRARRASAPAPSSPRYAGRGLSARLLRELAERPMAALAEATGETINLAVAAADGVEHTSRRSTSRHFLGTSALGRPPRAVPLHRERQGAARLRRRPAPPRARSRRSPRAPSSSRRALAAELATRPPRGLRDRRRRARARARARSPRPCSTSRGRAVAALSVSGPTLRLSPRRVAELRPIVDQAGAGARRSARPSSRGSARRMTARRDPHPPLRGDAGRQRARREGRRRTRGSSRAWTRRRCSTTR